MNRKCSAILLSLCLAAGMLSGCAGREKSSGGIALDFWTIDLRENYRDYFEQLISEYENRNPGVEIHWTDVQYDAMRAKLDSAIEAGKAPDVVNLNTQMALTFAGEGKLTDLNQTADEKQKSIYTQSLWESAKIGESVYAFPWYASPEIMFYNKELLKAGGLENPPADYDEALAEAADFHDKTGAYLFAPDEFFYILMEEGIPILNEGRTKAVFNTKEAADLLVRYQKAADQKAIPNNLWGDWEDELALYESSKLAMISSSGSALSDMKENASYIYKRTGISAPMKGSSGLSENSLMNLAVPSGSDHIKEATDFAAYVTDDENQLAFCRLVSIFPSTKKASQDAFFMEDSDTPEGQASRMSAEAAQSSKDFSLGVADQDSIQETIDLVFDAVVLEHEDPEKALDEAVEDVNEILEQHTKE
ncbi:MAG: sugar ABC transporter substrate-binding protein [Eubacterium sp.]|nr:sugar ABC transporter substrate-binding protein [Eubacterium sp.]